jgi:hypothetical protein
VTVARADLALDAAISAKQPILVVRIRFHIKPNVQKEG